MNTLELLEKTVKIAQNAGDFIMQCRSDFSQENVEEKGLHNFVSYVDKQAEQQIIAALKELIPDSGFVAEEGTAQDIGESYRWIVDPLDGTTNFIHGIPVFSVSIALQENGKTILGVVHEPNLRETFSAALGHGAQLNGERIFVSNCNNPHRSLLATGFPYHDYALMGQYLALMNELMQATGGLRRLGSAAIDLAYVACGRLEGFYEYGLAPWDVAAGALLVTEAGGIVSDWSGGDNFLFGERILAASKEIHPIVLNIIGKHFDNL
jgi:myo-inositol-1(or 4)-monophosphatase